MLYDMRFGFPGAVRPQRLSKQKLGDNEIREMNQTKLPQEQLGFRVRVLGFRVSKRGPLPKVDDHILEANKKLTPENEIRNSQRTQTICPVHQGFLADLFWILSSAPGSTKTLGVILG